MLKYFLIEEYRRHLAMAKKYSLFVFPLYIMFFTVLGGMFVDEVFAVMPYRAFILITLISTLIYGFGVGSFEFLGRTMEKFTLVNTFSILPISAKKTYFYAFLRDAIYYTLLFILPMYAGLLIAAAFSHLTAIQVSVFALSVLSSVFIGYSLAYTSFALYSRSKPVYVVYIILVFVYLVFAYLGITPLFTAEFQFTKNSIYLALALLVIVIFSGSGYFLTVEEQATVQKQHKAAFGSYLKRFKDALLAKEMLDVIRGGILLKSTLTYFLPMILLFIFVRVLSKISSSNVYTPLSLTVMLSIFSTVVYSWLTIMDDYRYMALLPLSPWDIIKAHMKAHVIIVSIVSVPIIIYLNLSSLTLLFPAFALFYLNVAYLLSITAYLAGYRVTSMLFDPEIVIKFSLYSVVPGIILTISSLNMGMLNSEIIIGTSAAMLIIAWVSVKRAKKKWLYFD